MTTDYNEIAREYQQAKLQPWRSAIEAYSLWKHVGDLHGLSVIDLACGEGHYSRLAKLRGARRVLGVDLSEQMVRLARSQETAKPLGVEYAVGDCSALEQPEEFDLALAAYLLNYARTTAELERICRSVAGRLRPGGRFITVNSSPFLDFAAAPSYRPYGFELQVPSDVGRSGAILEGMPIRWKFYLDGRSFEIENYYLSPATHERALLAAGFRELRWSQPELEVGALSEHAPGYWDAFLTHPPVVLLEARR